MPNGDDLDFNTRLHTGSYRCGNVNFEADKMKLFVDGILLTTRTMVIRYRETQPRWDITAENLVKLAREEG